MNRKVLLLLSILASPAAVQATTTPIVTHGQEMLTMDELIARRYEIAESLPMSPDANGNTITQEETEMSLAQIERDIMDSAAIEAADVQAYFPNYTLNETTQNTIADYTNQYLAIHTEAGTGEDSEEGMTYEEAIAYADANPDQVDGFWQIYRDSMTNNGIYGYTLTQAQYDWLPDDAAYWAFVHHSQVNTTGGDPGTALAALFEVYPELESVTDSPESGEEMASVPEETPIEEEPNDTFVINDTEIIIDNYYILRPGEAGNQTEDQYMFVVKFENEQDEALWYNNVTVGQMETLNRAEYQIEDAEADENQETTQFAYYTLTDLTTAVRLNFQDQVYEVEMEELFNLPPASAGYLADGNVQALVFDFGTVYGLAQGEVSAEVFEPVADEPAISPEVQQLIDAIEAETGIAEWFIYELEADYAFDEETGEVQVTKAEDNSEVGAVSTDSNWQDLTFDGVQYFGIHDWTELEN